MRMLASRRRARPQFIHLVRETLVRTAVGGFIGTVLGCAGDPAGPCDPDPPTGELGTICGFQNPEDVEVVASLGALIVSEMVRSGEETGSLSAVDLRVDPPTPRRLWPDDTTVRTTVPTTRTQRIAPRPHWLDADCTTPPKSDRFSPHGIGAHDAGDGTALLAVVSHGPREAIEVFELQRPEGEPLRARWLGCVRLPPRTMANDVIVSGRGSVLTTRYRPTLSAVGAVFYDVIAGLGGNTGEVLQKLPGQSWQKVVNSQAAGPNGLLQSANAVYFAQTGLGSISAVSHDGGRRDVSIEGYPDNLSWSPDGEIYAVSHTEGLGFVVCSAGKRPCRTAWSLFEIEPDSLRVRERLRHDGSVLGAVASVAYFEGRLFFGAVFGDRIGVLRDSGDRGAGVLQTAESNGSE